MKNDSDYVDRRRKTIEQSIHDRLAYVIKHNVLVQLLYRYTISFAFQTIGLFVKTDENLILLNSYGGEQYSDSTKVLYEAMLNDSRFCKYHFVWAFDNLSRFTKDTCSEVHNDRTKLVKIDTFVYFLTALKAKVWISNVNIERGLHIKKNNTIYLNTWHGTAPKKGGNAYKGRKDYDFSYVDILCVDGEYEKNVMTQMYNGLEKNMLWCGRPREDELFTFNESDSNRIRNKLNIPVGKKVLLYMPTWREGTNHELDWDMWEKRLKNQFVTLVRTHHFSKANIFSEHENGFWIDVSTYSNVNELYWIADILISDYSSAIFDFGLLGKPVISFAKDHDEYMEEYGLFMDNWATVFPNGVMQTDEQVIQYIETIDYEEQAAKCKKFIDSIVCHPGNATQVCLDRLCQLLGEK